MEKRNHLQLTNTMKPPSPSCRLQPQAPDVSPFLGCEAQLVIRDAVWRAYIAVDEI